MEGNYVVVIDVGSSNVVIAAGQTEPGGKICIKGIVSKNVDGVESGRIDNSDMVCQAIAAAKSEIEERLGIGITEAYAGISGEFVRCAQITDHVYVEDDSQNSNNVTQRDVDALDRRMRSVKVADDRETVMTSEPLRYMVDRREVKAPVGSFGKVLSAVYNFVLCDKIMRERLISVIQRSGITVKEVVPNALVAPLAVANSDEMHDGVATVDLGGGVTDVTVCYGGKVRYMASIPIGAQAVNADIRSYSIPEKYVEELKVNYGHALVDAAPSDNITFQRGSRITKSILSKNLATIIEARMSEIAEHARREIRDSGYAQKLSSGVILTGGSSSMPDIEQLFTTVMGCEVRTAYPEYGITQESMELITTPAFSTAVSLLIYGSQHGCCNVVDRRGIAVEEQRQEEPQPAAEPQPQPQPRTAERPAAKHAVRDDFDDFDDDESDDIVDSSRQGMFSKLFKRIAKGTADIVNSFENPDEEPISSRRDKDGDFGKRSL